jgi:hypothetical protein
MIMHPTLAVVQTPPQFFLVFPGLVLSVFVFSFFLACLSADLLSHMKSL